MPETIETQVEVVQDALEKTHASEEAKQPDPAAAAAKEAIEKHSLHEESK